MKKLRIFNGLFKISRETFSLFHFFTFSLLLVSCARYTTPPHSDWSNILRGASIDDMTPTAVIAKSPIYMGAGGRDLNASIGREQIYGTDPNTVATQYMKSLEFDLYNALRKPGISVQRAGTDVVVILVRDSLMQLDAPEFSPDGIDTLKIITKILKQYDASFIEVSGYTDATRNTQAARGLSMDMAQRVSLFFVENKIIPQRLFITGRGSARPIAAQDAVGRLTNRRIELRITPVR